MRDGQRLVDLIRSHEGGPAVVHGGRHVDFPTLLRMVDDRAAQLREAGAAGAYVALERDRSIGFVVDMLAVLSTGGAAIPLDPALPPVRRNEFLRLARPDVLLGDDIRRLPGGGGHRGGAFVYFTSGSTGVPKPVLGSAYGVRTFAEWFGPEFGIGPGDRFAFLTGVGFEASLRDIFPALGSGATLVIPDTAAPVDGGPPQATPEETVAWLAAAGITVLTAVPSVARGWLRAGSVPVPSVRAVFFVGEPVPADVLRDWSRTFPGTAVRVNSYGSTEGGQATVYHRIPAGATGEIPAGRLVPGTRFCLIDRDSPEDPASPNASSAPDGRLDAAVVRARLDTPADSGEIVLVSRACSHGYLDRPDEQAARFADLGDGLTAYRTGDLGRVGPDGDLYVVGRADDEVKINGVRVHPAEATRALRAHPAVADAYVVATRDPDPRLTAYVVPAEAAPDVSVLRRALLDELPLAMIPGRFVMMPGLPVTRTGKVDRAALTARAAAEIAAEAASEGAAPRGDTQEWLAAQFADLLDVSAVSAGDDLFALGGDSIAATRLAARVARDFGLTVPLPDVFAAATLEGIAALIEERQLLDADPAELRDLLDALDRGA
jgi:acyl-coenzyme A synthetase/AMP-(fatty) acid ligase/acyl carrier protein